MTDVPASAIHTATLPGINREWLTLREYGTSLFWKKGDYFDPYKGEKSFYFIEEGNLLIMHGAANGQARNLIYMQAGSLLNLAHALGSSLTSFIDAGCYFFCLTDVRVWRFPASLLADEKFVSNHSALIINLMQSLGVRLLMMHNTIASSSNGDAVSRLARFCLNMSSSYEGRAVFPLDLSLSELANLLGMHRISLFRAAKKLQNAGALKSLDREKIEISDTDVLKRIAFG